MKENKLSGLGTFAKRAKSGDALTVVFLGGSLTWGANASDPNRTSYRALIGEKLRSAYPEARWRFVDAAIGGTGSALGIFRVDRDVLNYQPDLLFLDFCLNDGLYSVTDASLSSYEAIVRRVLEKAACPVVPVLLASKENVLREKIEDMTRRTAHLKLAEYYNLQPADVILGMRELHSEGKLDLDVAWPPELFDNTHPHDRGYAVYAALVWDAFLAGVAANRTPLLPPKWMNKENYKHICRKRLSDLKELPAGWKIGYPEVRAGTFDFLCSRWMDNVAIAENCVRKGFDKFELTGAKPKELTVKFRGSSVSIFGESTVNCGKLKVKIDGKEQPNAIDAAKFGTAFAPSAYLSVSLAAGLDPKQEHTLTLIPELAPDKPRQIRIESICVAGEEAADVYE